MTLLRKPPSVCKDKGILIPVLFCPITIELSLVDTMTDPIIDVSIAPSGAIAATDYSVNTINT